MPKASDAGDSVSVAADCPVPVRGAVCIPSESAMERVPDRVPDAPGVNTIAIWQLACAIRLAPQVLLLMAKSPVTLSPLSATGEPPVFAIVTLCAAAVEPIRVAGKLIAAGVRTILPGVAPVPESATTVEALRFDALSVRLPVSLVAVVGAKSTPIWHDAPAASDAGQLFDAMPNPAVTSAAGSTMA